MTETMRLACEISIGGTSYDALWVEVVEPLDDLPRVRALITDRALGPEPSAVINKPVVLTIERRGDAQQTRTLAGYVVEAESTTLRGDEEGEVGTRLVIRPRLYKLTQRTDCRTFQAMTAKDIVTKVLTTAGLSGGDQAWHLSGSYSPRTYTVQYRETDYDFVRRVLAEEGIAFTVDSSSGKDVATFFDGDLGPIAGQKTIGYSLGDGLHAGSDAIGAVTCEKSTVPGKVHLRDYDFEHPRLKLDSKADAGEPTEASLEVYHYPGRFTQPSVGDHYAKALLDSLRARREVLRGLTSTLRLYSGHTFQLDDHPYSPLNQEYLVIEVTTVFDARRLTAGVAQHDSLASRGSDGAAESPAGHGAKETTERMASRMEFAAIPTKNTTYRPPRIPRAVSAPGAQIATTTGPAGKEIHPDKHGRVKVIFPWDRLGKPDDTSSLWIRTCQLPLGGIMLTPRVGWEAALNFTDGDPDLPFIFGRFYNAVKPPPYALPANKTRMSLQTATTPGGGSTNEIRMDDKAGHEEMFMNASKDASVSAGNNATESVGNNETRAIGADQSLAVTGAMSAHIGAAQSMNVGGSQTIHVATKMVDDVGSHSHTIGGGRNLTVAGDHKHTVTAASQLHIGSMQVDLVAGSSDEKALATMDETIGAVLLELTAGNRSVTTTGARTENAGAAKVILAKGGRAVEISGNLSQKVGAGIVNKVSATCDENCEGNYLEVAGGAQLTEAVNVVFSAQSKLAVIMGGSAIVITPASVSIAGTNITLKGDVAEEAVLVADN